MARLGLLLCGRHPLRVLPASSRPRVPDGPDHDAVDAEGPDDGYQAIGRGRTAALDRDEYEEDEAYDCYSGLPSEGEDDEAGVQNVAKKERAEAAVLG